MTRRSKVVALGGALLIAASSVSGVFASSHREAPLISGDPSADNTDLYAFVSPDDPTKLTIVANYIPLQQPGGGPNFHPFDDSVRYRIHIDNTGDAKDDVTYTIRFKTHQQSGKDGVSSFLYNNGPIATVNDATWLAPQTFTRRAHEGRVDDLARLEPAHRAGQHRPALHARLCVPRRHRRPRPVQRRQGLRRAARRRVLRRPRLDLRPRWPAAVQHAACPPARHRGRGRWRRRLQHRIDRAPGADHARSARSAGQPVVGVWASADRKANKEISTDGKVKWSGPWVQVSRLGDPLINEVIIPRHLKDYWNGQAPSKDSQFLKYYEAPELAGLVNFLYPALADVDTTGRTDLSLILLKGVPGVNRIGSNPVAADMLRLNTAILPGVNGACPGGTASAAGPDRLAVLAADLCGFPNGRRLVDDVTDIELRAIAQGYGTFLNGAFGLPNRPRTTRSATASTAMPTCRSWATFPYIGLPHSGYESVPPLRPMVL